MRGEILQFKVRSGGTVTIELERCVGCESRACLAVCDIQGGPLVLDKAKGVPGLRMAPPEIERGGCVECLGCELDCSLFGRSAVTILLPLDRLDEYLALLTEPVVYAR
jgi:formate hydrogenlyase subunit 6/NADH:ubiquinone oxidoreductase subunit I